MVGKFFKTHYSYLITVVAVLTIAITNYVPNTYLMGWDNLQTDLNPILGVKRAFFAVWQEYQSFGLTSGLAHSADVLRAVFIWFLSLILPSTLLRYSYHFLMTLIGGLGMLHLLKAVVEEKSKAFILLGALFYIFNFGTVQIFYLPWESFSTFFAVLPWALWIFTELLKNINKKKYWALFIIINLLSTPSFYVQTVFIVYILILMCVAIGYCLENRSIKVLKRSFLIMSVIVLLNSFWIFPQIYSFITRAEIISNAKNNLLFTESALYRNLAKGDLFHFLKMEGLYSDLYGQNKTPLFLAWKEHFNNIFILIISLSLSFIAIVGIVGSLFKKTYFRISYFFIFLLVAIALLGKVQPFDKIQEVLRANSLFNQIFRSPFTKFIVPYSLVASYGFAMGINILYDMILKSPILRRIPKASIIIFLSLLIFIYSLPSFKGNFISSEVRVKIPLPYSQVINFFNHEDKNKRIALLPDSTSLDWFNNRWGYTGSGFLWYDIEQPIVSRTFDAWSNTSESYYWEEKAALEAEDINKFEIILEKYNVNYLLYDKSLLPIFGSTRSMQYDKLDSMLKKSKIITQVHQWDFIYLYKVNHTQNVNSFVQVTTSLPNIGPNIGLTNNDTAYSTYGQYMTTQDKPFQLYFPFLDLTTQTKIAKKAWNIFDSSSEWIFTSHLPFNANQYFFVSNLPNETSFDLYLNDNLTKIILPLFDNIENNTIFIRFPKFKISNFDMTKGIVENCSYKEGQVNKKNQETSIAIKTEKGITACITYSAADISQAYGYLIKINHENLKGQKILFYILDDTNEQNYLEDRLTKNETTHLIAPRFSQGRGYSFIFQNNSYENTASENILKSFDIYLIPYDTIKNIALQKNNTLIEKVHAETNFEVKKINYFSYLVSGKSLYGNKTLTLYQSFDKGWKAYEIKVKGQKSKVKSSLENAFPFLFGKELKEHVLVNNWANGWVIDNKSAIEQWNNRTIVIIFWPQYLEYAGFVILIATFSFLTYKALLDKQKESKKFDREKPVE